MKHVEMLAEEYSKARYKLINGHGVVVENSVEDFKAGYQAAQAEYEELMNRIESKLTWVEVYKEQDKMHLSFTILKEALAMLKAFRERVK